MSAEPLPPQELFRLVDEVWRKYRGRRGEHVLIEWRLDFGDGDAMSVRVMEPTGPCEGRWKTYRIGRQ